MDRDLAGEAVLPSIQAATNLVELGTQRRSLRLSGGQATRASWCPASVMPSARSKPKPKLLHLEKSDHVTATTTKIEDAPPEKRGGIREGAGRPKGPYGGKKLRELLQTYKAAVKLGQLTHAGIAARDLPAAMLEAQVHVDKRQAEFDPAFLKRQANKGVCRKEALRKLKWARLQLAKAA